MSTAEQAKAQPVDPFKPSVKQGLAAKVALYGPSKSGKSLMALAIARALVGPGEPVAVLDTENGRIRMYSDDDVLQPYRVAEMHAPFSPNRFIKTIQATVAAGYKALIIDGISPAWEDEGGVQDIADHAPKDGNNKFSGWKHASPHQRALQRSIVTCPIHLVITVRSKMAYEIIDGKPQKLGLKPVQREGFEYEIDFVGNVDMKHVVTWEARGPLNGRVVVPDEGDELTDRPYRSIMRWAEDAHDWLNSGAAQADGREPGSPAGQEPGATPATPEKPADGGQPDDGGRAVQAQAADNAGVEGDALAEAEDDLVPAEATNGAVAMTAEQMDALVAQLNTLTELRSDVDWTSRINAKGEEYWPNEFTSWSEASSEQAVKLADTMEKAIRQLREAAAPKAEA